MKNTSDTIGNRIGDFPAYRAVPQQTAPTPTPMIEKYLLLFPRTVSICILYISFRNVINVAVSLLLSVFLILTVRNNDDPTK